MSFLTASQMLVSWMLSPSAGSTPLRMSILHLYFGLALSCTASITFGNHPAWSFGMLFIFP